MGAILDPMSDPEDHTLTRVGIDTTKPTGRDFADDDAEVGRVTDRRWLNYVSIDRVNIEIDKVVPRTDPYGEQAFVRRFHQLKTNIFVLIYP